MRKWAMKLLGLKEFEREKSWVPITLPPNCWSDYKSMEDDSYLKIINRTDHNVFVRFCTQSMELEILKTLEDIE